MKNKTIRIALMCIVIFGMLLRIYKFAQVPGGVNRDEAALGYNAYSLLMTGKDEWGVRYPLVFTSFGDYKLAGYIYTLIPFVKLFGLNAFAVRLPSLIAGVLLPIAVFFLIQELSKRPRFALFAALMVVWSPWAIFYSRVGFEANLALCLFVFGLYAMLRTLGKRRWLWLSIALVTMFVSLMTYNTPLILLPLILVTFFIAFGRKILPAIASIGLVTVLVFALIRPAVQGKQAITIFSDPTYTYAQRTLRHNATNPISHVLSTVPVYFGGVLVKNYVATYLPDFLVIRGGSNPWHQPPYASHLTWLLYLLAILGVILAIKARGKTEIVLLSLLVMGPIPSAITTDAPHATRSLLFLLMLGVFAAYALNEIWKCGRIIAEALIVLQLISVACYLLVYFTVTTPGYLQAWNVGLLGAISEAEARANLDHEPIFFVGDIRYEYILPLFYNNVDPNYYRVNARFAPADALGFTAVQGFGNTVFVSGDKPVSLRGVVIAPTDSGGFSVTEHP
jgi:4-amino-4-deoxy-L-arabinose transferase-like glycosyltransferase